jgi:hypothetical protein
MDTPEHALGEHAARQAPSRRYEVLARLAQLTLGGLPSPHCAHEALVLLLEALELSSEGERASH